MKIEYTNFDGDWDADCPFCGNSQRSHQVDLGEEDGIQFIHRQPCPAEQRHITKQYMIRANTMRVIGTLYEIAVYLWNKIPLKEEAVLLSRIAKRVYISVRGIWYFWFKYQKKN